MESQSTTRKIIQNRKFFYENCKWWLMFCIIAMISVAMIMIKLLAGDVKRVSGLIPANDQQQPINE